MFEKKYLTDAVDVTTDDGMIGICCQEVGAVIFSDLKTTEDTLTKLKDEPESEYKKWGGKRGFLTYLLGVIKKEDKFFNKNRHLIDGKYKRYQNFCDDVALYEVMKSAVTGEPMSALDPSLAKKHWGNYKK